MRFHDSTPKILFSKHQNKAEFKNLDDSEVLSSDFTGLKTLQPLWPYRPQQPNWPRQPKQPYFIKKLPDSDSLALKWPIGPFLWNESSKTRFCTDFGTSSVGGCWGQAMFIFWKLVHETQMPIPLEVTRHHNLINYWFFYPSEAFTFIHFNMRPPVHTLWTIRISLFLPTPLSCTITLLKVKFAHFIGGA